MAKHTIISHVRSVARSFRVKLANPNISFSWYVIFQRCVCPQKNGFHPKNHPFLICYCFLLYCILSRVWWFFLLLMDYFDKLLLTAPLKNYRNMFSLPYLFLFFPKSLLFWKLKSLGGSQGKDFELEVIQSPWPHVSISYSKQKPS